MMPRNHVGSTPAWAGKPASHSHKSFTSGVYPRVGGETFGKAFLLRALVGSTPAWAGKPCILSIPQTLSAVYPRVGGETLLLTQEGVD